MEYNKSTWAKAMLIARGDKTQTQFATDSGLSISFIQKSETGRYPSRPSVDKVRSAYKGSDGSVSIGFMFESAGYSDYEAKDDMSNRLLAIIESNGIDVNDTKLMNRVCTVLDLAIKIMKT